jgi:hypothetical protein
MVYEMLTAVDAVRNRLSFHSRVIDAQMAGRAAVDSVHIFQDDLPDLRFHLFCGRGLSFIFGFFDQNAFEPALVFQPFGTALLDSCGEQEEDKHDAASCCDQLEQSFIPFFHFYNSFLINFL